MNIKPCKYCNGRNHKIHLRKTSITIVCECGAYVQRYASISEIDMLEKRAAQAWNNDKAIKDN